MVGIPATWGEEEYEIALGAVLPLFVSVCSVLAAFLSFNFLGFVANSLATVVASFLGAFGPTLVKEVRQVKK